jgi:hypothetical protein
MALYASSLIFTFLDSRWKDKRLWTEWYESHFNLILNQTSIYYCSQIYELCHISNHLFATFVMILSCILVVRQQYIFSFLYVYFETTSYEHQVHFLCFSLQYLPVEPHN